MSLVEIGDNFISTENRKNAKAIAFAFLTIFGRKRIWSKMTGVVQGDSNVPLDQPPRVSSSENPVCLRGNAVFLIARNVFGRGGLGAYFLTNEVRYRTPRTCYVFFGPRRR